MICGKCLSVLKTVLVCAPLVLGGCVKVPEMTLPEIEEVRKNSFRELLNETQTKPYNLQEFVPGALGGVWYDYINSDPKTFNHLIGERDGESTAIIDSTTDSFTDYDMVSRKWIPRLCFFEIETDEEKGTLTVHYTLRDGLCWTYPESSEKIPVTADDIVWWYNEVAWDPQFQSSAYGAQFVAMPDGSVKKIQVVKVDERRFDFVFPRIVADPLLATNATIKPSFIYKKAKKENGAEGIKNLFSINSDPKKIPSIGRWYISNYIPGQKIILTRNPNFWQKDSKGESIPYVKETVLQITGDNNTAYLLFKQGKLETYSSTPENLEDVIRNQKSNYTVFNAEASFGAQFISFNQNPVHKYEAYYDWFTKKEFRQAMSCLLNRERIIEQTYRGLASAKLDFFPEPNSFYNPDIKLKYLFDKDKAVSLLASIGITRDENGIMRDKKKHAIEYDLSIASQATTLNDIAQIFAEECSSVGIKVNVRQTDFQKLVESLSVTYDWQAVIIGLGANLFPSQGNNVWPSNTNLHLWYPFQPKPATDWEARIDWLYNEGCHTLDTEKAKKIWDEYQTLILEQCPIIYLFSPRSFVAIQNRWNLTNFYYDNKYGAFTDYIFLRSGM